jgi:phytoene dehydrogenase-like protein
MKWLKLFENFNEITNIVIIGGGISSLYAAYLLKKNYPKIKYTLIEKSDECGGRVKMSNLGDVKITTGAYFTRVDKDKTLLKLVKDLDIKLNPYVLDIDYSFNESEVGKLVDKLKQALPKYDRSKIKFKEFAKDVLGKDYNNFINMMGYTDFENADINDTLFNYGLEDNIPGYKVMNLDWSKVIEKLANFIGKENIVLNTEVKSIKEKNNSYLINSKYECDGVIIGVTIKSLKNLLDNKIYNQIESQEFIKVFAKSKDLDVNKYTVVDSELRKVIPVKDDVYKIAYSDNKDAISLKSKGTTYFEELLSKTFNKDIRINSIKKFFWEEGTHYYKPLPTEYRSRKEFIKEAQHPKDNIWVIGEVVAERQGWVEGALSSVEKISLFKK